WKNVSDHKPAPAYYFESLSETGILGTFHIPEVFPDDEYIIRLRLINTLAKSYDFLTSVYIDKTPPILLDTVKLLKRYNQESSEFYLNLLFNEKVDVSIDCYIDNCYIESISSNQQESNILIKIPDNLPEGDLRIVLQAENGSGLTLEHETITLGQINWSSIETNGYTLRILGNPLYPAKDSFDFHGNGLREFPAMDISESGINNVAIYEIDNYSLNIKYQFPFEFIPFALGNSNSSGVELFGLTPVGNGIVFETLSADTYPDFGLPEIENIKGGNFIKSTGSNDNLAIVKTENEHQAVVVYYRENMVFVPRNFLFNTTESTYNNFLVPRVIGDNFDGDEYLDIISADLDGDVIIHEIYSQGIADETGQSELVWSQRLPVKNAYFMEKGDFNGDGQIDFLVGGYNEDTTNPSRDYWYFESFTAAGDNIYESLGSISFSDFNSQNSITTADITGDNSDEIILALTPNLYIVDFADDNFVPIYQGTSHKTYQVLTLKDNNTTGILVNTYLEGQLRTALYCQEEEFNGPPTPDNFKAQTINESSVKLTWTSDQSQSFRIYRRTDSQPEMIAEVFDNFYIDTQLQQNTEFFYAISRYNEEFTPPESRLTSYKRVFTAPVPVLESVKMISECRVLIKFDQAMSSNSLKPGNFFINNGIGYPSSVNSTANQKAFLLTFRDTFSDTIQEYSLSVSNLISNSGVAFPDSNLVLHYEQDMVPPYITGGEISGEKEVVIFFSELLAQETTVNSDNYTLFLPDLDSDNSISEIIYRGNELEFKLEKEIKQTTQTYKLMVKNVSDYSGNVIINANNVYSFNLTKIDDLNFVKIIPNPFYRNSEAGLISDIRFVNIPLQKRGTIKIYSLDGDLVFEEKFHSLTADNPHFSWRIVNNHGNRVAPGVYFYIVEMGSKTKKGKFAIIE
ncbi:MAG: VCBS repeat-containing protein, partial [Candidatus Cloacimonetes bacterium]|nr:VCBS repeat-containing protein [Candidatus Cloacimonadota bacterium]